MNIFKKMLYKIYFTILYVYYQIFWWTIFKKNICKWHILSGTDNYFTNHNLSDDSIVFEIGGYTWFFSDIIIGKYNCYMYIFEPVEEYYNILKEKYKNNTKIKVFQFWLSNNDAEVDISKAQDWTSVYKNNWNSERIKLVDFNTLVSQQDLSNIKVDLISINIEWWEYDLLERILETKPNMMQSIQVQFHDFVIDAEKKREKVLFLLEKNGYKKWYSFPFVWEFFTKY